MADPTYINYYTDSYAIAYSETAVTYDLICPQFDPNDATITANMCVQRVGNLSQNQAVFLAYVDRRSPGSILVAHDLEYLAAPPGRGARSYENHLNGVLGYDPSTTVPVTFPDADDLFDIKTVCVHDDLADARTALAAQRTAHPNTCRIPPLDPAVAGQGNIQVRRALVLPTEWKAGLSRGQFAYTYNGFYDTFIQPALADPVQTALIGPIIDWYKAAITSVDDNGTAVCAQSLTVVAPGPISDMNRQAWHASRVKRHMATIRKDAPALVAGLNNAVTGINDVGTNVATLQATIEAHETARADARAADRTFTQRYGTAAAAYMHKLCGVGGDDDLPPLLKQLAASKDKSNDTAIINLAMFTAGNADPFINPVNTPRATPHLVSLLRTFNLIGIGVEIGDGLTPFATICQGHPQSKSILELADQQQSMEAGNNSMSLADSAAFKVKDPRFPRSLIQVVDKLRAYKIQCQVILGANNRFVVALDQGITTILPQIYQLESTYQHNPKQAIMYGLRVIMWVQQSTFLYLRKVRDQEPVAPPARLPDVPLPDYEELADKLSMGMHNLALPTIPEAWMELIKSQLPEYFTQEPERIRGGGPGDSAGKQGSGGGKVVVINSKQDQSLKKRWVDSGHETIKELLSKGNNPDIPKYGQTPVCLSWCLKGKCTSDCPRANAHKHYGDALVKQIHEVLTVCQVVGAPRQ